MASKLFKVLVLFILLLICFTMSNLNYLIDGCKAFCNDKTKDYFTSLSMGQSPKAIFVACSDSRIDPAILTQAEPGDIFSVRNVANLIPPYENDNGYHGTSSAIEFAVTNLGIKDIVIMGHSCCAGIAALVKMIVDEMQGKLQQQDKSLVFVKKWISIAKPALQDYISQNYDVKSITDKDISKIGDEAAKISIKQSVENLMSFPFIQQKLVAGKIEIHGWFFAIEQGSMYKYNATSDCFTSAV